MNTLNKTIINSTVEEDFNGNHTKLQGQEHPIEKSTIQEQGRIL